MEKSAQTHSAHELALASRHADLEARIAELEHRPFPDAAELAQLKKAKLRIKDTLLSH